MSNFPVAFNWLTSVARIILLVLAVFNADRALGQNTELPSASPASSVQAPNLILYNGKVFTSDSKHLHAEAVAILGERIVAVGANADVKSLADAHTELIDLQGRTVVPGLNDAHAHLSIDPKDEVPVETQGYDPGWRELADAIGKAAASAPKGALLFGGFGTAVFYDPSVDRAALDKVVSDHPLILASFDGHAAILNSAALDKFGIGENTVDPAGGRYERGPDGRLTGVVREYAFDGVLSGLAAITSDEDAEDSLRKQLERAARYGITTIQDMPIAVSTERTVRLLARMPTPIRVRVTRMNMTTPSGPNYKENTEVPSHPAPLITVSGTKWVLDGVVYEGSLTPRNDAAKVAPSGGPYSFAGLPPLFAPQVVDEMLRDALHNNDHLQLHVAGTPAATEALDSMERTGGARVWAGRRVRFEHGDGLTPALVARAKKLGVIVSQQGSHLDILGIDSGLGPDFLERLHAQNAEPLRSLLEAGVALALGSDGPLNPWLSVLGATTDPDRPEEAITREQAVTAYTYGSAYAEFQEKEKGSLMPGKLADLAVLSQDIFTISAAELPKTRSLLTIVGGRVVYDAHALAAK